MIIPTIARWLYESSFFSTSRNNLYFSFCHKEDVDVDVQLNFIKCVLEKGSCLYKLLTVYKKYKKFVCLLCSYLSAKWNKEF